MTDDDPALPDHSIADPHTPLLVAPRKSLTLDGTPGALRIADLTHALTPLDDINLHVRIDALLGTKIGDTLINMTDELPGTHPHIRIAVLPAPTIGDNPIIATVTLQWIGIGISPTYELQGINLTIHTEDPLILRIDISLPIAIDEIQGIGIGARLAIMSSTGSFPTQQVP